MNFLKESALYNVNWDLWPNIKCIPSILTIPGPPFPRPLLDAFWLALAAACVLTEGPESDPTIYKQYRDWKEMIIGKLLYTS